LFRVERVEQIHVLQSHTARLASEPPPPSWGQPKLAGITEYTKELTDIPV
jgi:hypothetical protein